MIGALWNRVRNHLYDKGVFSTVRPAEFVISVGNLTWGGTGKTALTEYLAKLLIFKGYKVGILSRGHGRESRGVVVVSDGSKILQTWQNSGDEPYWLACNLPQAAVVVAESRAEGLPSLLKFQPGIILLDDAFQHRSIARDIDLVLVDASENIRSLRVLPFGKLREPIDGLDRASAIVLTHSKSAHLETLDMMKNVHVPIFHANYQPVDFQFRGKRVAAFCGIASPKHFQALLEQQGATLVFFREFPDHHIYSSSELNQLQKEAVQAGAEALVTTTKDSVKFNENDFRIPLGIIHVELRIEEEENFQSWIIHELESRKPAGIVMNKS